MMRGEEPPDVRPADGRGVFSPSVFVTTLLFLCVGAVGPDRKVVPDRRGSCCSPLLFAARRHDPALFPTGDGWDEIFAPASINRGILAAARAGASASFLIPSFSRANMLIAASLMPHRSLGTRMVRGNGINPDPADPQ